ncbi:MAG: VPS10 domain-containing protein [Thermoanaerobaculia bacterium]
MPLRRLLSALFLLASSTAFAAVDPSLFQDLRWRLIGPFRGGRVLAVTGVPGEPEHFYFGSVNGGVWETGDAGRTWRPIFDGQPIGSIGALAVAPSNPRVIYVGSGEADMRSDIAQGNGMYKSTDGGRAWSHIGLEDSQQIGRVLVDPRNADVVYVAALGHPYGPNAERGVFRSRDGGKTWQKVLSKDENTGAIDLAFEPGSPDVIYAALWQTRRTPWHIYPPSNGPGGGLWKSTDGGEHWTQITGHGFPDKPGRIGLAVAPSQPRRVYAMVDVPEMGGLYRSDDAGATWTHVSGDNRIWGRGWYFGGITVEPKNPDVVYACNTALYRSEDGGKTFVPIKGAPGGDDYHQLWIDPQEPRRRIQGVDQGTVVSVDGGETWSSWFNQPTGQMYHVSTDNRFPYWVYGSQQDSGAAGVPSRTNTYDGITLTEFREVTAGGESDEIAPDPKDPQILYGGRVDRLDLRTMQTRSVDPALAYPDLYRVTWTLPIVFSPRDPKVMYFAYQRLFRTEDGGEHWTPVSPDLTREDPGVPPNLDPPTAANRPGEGSRFGVIYTIAPSRTADHDIWVGTDDGLIWRTRDEGAHWTNVTPAGLAPWSKVGILDASHFDPETAYAVVDRHRLDDFKPYVYRTHDGGRHWDLIAAGIPDGSFVNAVREDSARKGLLYAGTERGVYVSFDDGDHWQPLQLNLPVTSVRDLDVHGEDLVIATHGRAFWVLDGLAPLRQLDARVEGVAAWMFKPAGAVRFRPAGFTGSPMPKDEAMAANPAPGAYFDYVLKGAAKQVTLEIRDEKGGLVRRYSSADAAPKTDITKIVTAPQWVQPPSVLSAAAGMHRFVWPLRYAALKADNAYEDGVWAPPGRYTAVLDVDGTRLTQPLTVAPDPRVTLPAEAYARQFELARRIEEAQGRVARAGRENDALLKALADRRKGASPEVAKSLDALRKKAEDLAGGSAWWLSPTTLNCLRAVGDALNKLATAADGADAAPSPDTVDGFEKIQPSLNATLAAWETLKTKDLAALNAKLKKARMAAITLTP